MVRNDDLERATSALAALVECEARACRYHGAAMIYPRLDELLEKVDGPATRS